MRLTFWLAALTRGASQRNLRRRFLNKRHRATTSLLRASALYQGGIELLEDRLLLSATPPTIVAPTTTTVVGSGPLLFTGPNAITVLDTGVPAEQFSASVLEGTLNLATTTGLTVTGNGTLSVSLSGPLTSLNTDLASLGYTPNHGYSGPDTLTLNDTDTSDTLVATQVTTAIQVNPPTISAPVRPR
jgi:hypothetical protein